MAVRRLITRSLGLDSSGSRALRRRRFRYFLQLVDEILRTRDQCRILDIGGEPAYWTAVADLMTGRPYHVTLLNVTAYPVDTKDMASLAGDARDLHEFPDQSFDIVHSNSVIEHVGRWQDMIAMSREVRRLAPGYFVQTPYFWFPVEPHCSTAFFHWVPESVRLSMLMRKPRGIWGQAPDVDTAMRQIQSNSLLDQRMLQTLFPDAAIIRERFLGLTKSLIAIRRAGGSGAVAGPMISGQVESSIT
jgi:SAM-dependent methyltransferase